jgi:hypothetical protein
LDWKETWKGRASSEGRRPAGRRFSVTRTRPDQGQNDGHKNRGGLVSQQNSHITQKRLFRYIREANLAFEDPRGRQGRRHTFRALVNTLLLGCVCAARSHRAVEAITDCLHASVRKASGIPRRISDTALRATLHNLDLADLRNAILPRTPAMCPASAERPSAWHRAPASG